MYLLYKDSKTLGKIDYCYKLVMLTNLADYSVLESL